MSEKEREFAPLEGERELPFVRLLKTPRPSLCFGAPQLRQCVCRGPCSHLGCQLLGRFTCIDTSNQM